MKVVALNGSSRLIGNTSNLLAEFLDELGKEGVETEMVQLYDHELQSCNDCRSCEMRGDGRCIMEDDDMNDILDMMRAADGVVLAAPAYAGGVPGHMKTFLERAGLALTMGDRGLRGKVGAVLTVSAHDGGENAYNELTYWLIHNELNVVGAYPLPIFRALNSPQYEDDEQAMKGMGRLAENMVALLEKSARN